MTKAQKACWRKTLGVEESNVTFLFLGKKTSWSLFFPSPFHLVGIRPGARMQKSSLSMPPVRFLEKLKGFIQVNEPARGEWKCGAGWRRKASFKTNIGGSELVSPGRLSNFFAHASFQCCCGPAMPGQHIRNLPCKPKPWPQGQMCRH